VTTSYTAADLMDISVTEGVCVGLIVDKDPMGNKNRWFVDDGGMYDILRNYGKYLEMVKMKKKKKNACSKQQINILS
jgi:hypothetical protein